jgi:hypothetical protein
MTMGLVTSEHIEALADVAAQLDAKGLADESRRVRAVLAQRHCHFNGEEAEFHLLGRLQSRVASSLHAG